MRIRIPLRTDPLEMSGTLGRNPQLVILLVGYADVSGVAGINEVIAMQFYTVQQASMGLGEVIARAVHDHEEAAIVSDLGAVVLVPQDEFESMRETLRLLSDPRALKALLAGHAQRDERCLSDLPIVEQVFYDLQDSHS